MGKRFHDGKKSSLPPHSVLKNKLTAVQRTAVILQVTLYCGHKGTGKEGQRASLVMVFIVRPVLLFLASKLLQEQIISLITDTDKRVSYSEAVEQ